MNNSGQTTQREPHVTSQVNQLEKTISGLTEIINRLESRLVMILSDDGLKATSHDDEHKAEHIVPLAQTIAEYIARLQSQTNRLNEICNRIEL